LKKLVIFIIIIGGIFFLYKKGIIGGKAGAFDAQGNPTTIVYTFDDCNPCENAMDYLDNRDISYEEINISQDESRQKEFFSYAGGNQGPKIISGTTVVVGDNKQDILSRLAEAYGMEVLTQQEEDAMLTHFDEEGNPLVVMYGKNRCGYVKQARAYFNSQGVEFLDLNINRSGEASTHYNVLKGSGTPLIYFGYRRISGFNKSEIDKAIKEFL
jgi:glutaredoxin